MVRVTKRLESGLFNQAAFRRSLIREVTHWSFALEADMKIRIQQGAKTGRVYRRGPIHKMVGARKAREFQAMGLKRSKDFGPFRKGQQKFVIGFGFHRASAPGQSPASDSSNLVNSIKGERAVVDARGVHALVSINARYAAILEHGGGYVAPRPFRAPALRKIDPKFQRGIDALVARAAA